MTAFTVWTFETSDGAAHAEKLLHAAERDQLVKVVDDAIVSWPHGEPNPVIVDQGHDDTKRGAAWGAFWGLFVGACVTIPILGLAAGAGLGALAKATEKMGITEEQLESIGKHLKPGTSALFLVTEQGNLDRLGERMRGVNMKLIETNLTGAERSMLDEAIGS